MLLFFLDDEVRKKLPKGERAMIGKLVLHSLLNPRVVGSKVLNTKNCACSMIANKSPVTYHNDTATRG